MQPDELTCGAVGLQQVSKRPHLLFFMYACHTPLLCVLPLRKLRTAMFAYNYFTPDISTSQPHQNNK